MEFTFNVIGVTMDGRLVLSNGFTISGLAPETIKAMEEKIGHKIPVLIPEYTKEV